ncbi:MAG: hypothetical protein ACI9SP_000768 [Arenicella sp.]
MNPWEQGEFWHPGITKSTQDFLAHVDFPIDLSTFFTSRENSVFSNTVVAKKSYWLKWKSLASQFLVYADDPVGGISTLKSGYRNGEVSMKAFIQ